MSGSIWAESAVSLAATYVMGGTMRTRLMLVALALLAFGAESLNRGA